MNVRLTSLAFLFLAAPVNAEPVQISWTDQGKFQHEQAIETDGFAEVCGDLGAGERIAWTFDSSAALDFNIHYHEGEEVIYPVKATGSEAMADTLLSDINQTYCWMWTNRKDHPVNLNLSLSRDTR